MQKKKRKKKNKKGNYIWKLIEEERKKKIVEEISRGGLEEDAVKNNKENFTRKWQLEYKWSWNQDGQSVVNHL